MKFFYGVSVSTIFFCVNAYTGQKSVLKKAFSYFNAISPHALKILHIWLSAENYRTHIFPVSEVNKNIESAKRIRQGNNRTTSNTRFTDLASPHFIYRTSNSNQNKQSVAQFCARVLEQSMGARNRIVVPARQATFWPAELISFLGSLKV